MNYLRRQLGNLTGTIFANWLAFCFHLLFPLLYDIKVSGLRNYTASPSTLITINHKRDLDIPILGPLLHLHRTLFKNKLRLHFVARDDLFDPGFLTAHFLIPWPWGKLLHRVNIAPIMRALRASPISHLVHKRIGPLLRDIIRTEGDLKIGEVIKEDNLREFSMLLGLPRSADLSKLSVSDFLGYDYCLLHQRPTDVGILQEGLSRKVRTHSLDAIGKQLEVFACILDEGGICLLAPEGHLSPDGRFWPVKSGLHRLLSLTRADVRIVPVNTTYDFMTRGRMRIYVSIGKEITQPKEMGNVELERLVQRNIVGLGPVTMGQLGSEYLLQRLETGHEIIHEDELADELTSRVQALQKAGLRLDERLIIKHSFDKRIHDFISYCQKKHLLEKAAPGTFLIKRARVLNGSGPKSWSKPVQYSRNELHSLREQFPVF